MARTLLLSASLQLVALLVPGLAAGQDESEASERFEKGVSLFKAEDFGGALVEFQAAYDASPHFMVRYNIGMTLYRLHRYVEAESELTAYLAEGGDEVPKKRKKKVKSLLVDLMSYIGSLSLSCNVKGASVHVDGEFAATLPMAQPLRLDVGEHSLEVKAEGHASHGEKVSVPGGKQVELVVELEPLGEGPGDDAQAKPAGGKECAQDKHCEWPRECFMGECVSKQTKRNLESGGLNLMIPGYVLLGLGIPGLAAGLGLLTGQGPGSFELGWSPLAVLGAAAIVTSIPLIIVGHLSRKRVKNLERSGSTGVLLAPLPGGGLLGVTGTF
jgi:hypothetical protein